jgi:hypothetical protein
MAKKKKTRLQAILSASKVALRYLLQEDAPSAALLEVIEQLNSAIERAEGPEYSENISSVSLVMTHGTAAAFHEALDNRDDGSHEFKQLAAYVRDSERVTKQRVYHRLPIDHAMMRKVKMILLTTTTKHSDKAFKRLADQIEREGLSKNPLEILAELGL